MTVFKSSSSDERESLLGLRRCGDLDLLVLLGSSDLGDLDLDRSTLGSGLPRSDLDLEMDLDLWDPSLGLDLDLDFDFLGGLFEVEGLELGEGSFRFLTRFLPLSPLLLLSRRLSLPRESSESSSSERFLEASSELSLDLFSSSLFFSDGR